MYIPLYNGLNCVLIPPETEKRNKETVCKVEKIKVVIKKITSTSSLWLEAFKGSEMVK